MDGRSFRDFAENELELARERGDWIAATEANQRAADRILEGFDNPKDAGEHIRGLPKGSVLFDFYGWPFGEQAIGWAVWVKTNHLFRQFTKGTRVVTEDGRKGSVQHWGMPGKTKIKKASRRSAIKSGCPMLYIWFHDISYADWSWEYVDAGKVI